MATTLGFDQAESALLVSLTAIAVAVVALGWQIYAALRIDRARIRVTVQAEMVATLATGPTSVVIVTATNEGKRPARLSFLGLVLTPPVPWYRRLTRRQRGHLKGSIMLPDFQDLLLPNTPLPAPLDVGEEGHALFRRELVLDEARSGGAVTMHGLANTTAPSAPWSRGVPVPSVGEPGPDRSA